MAKEGLGFILLALILLLGLFLLFILFGNIVSLVGAIIFSLVLIFSLLFFRDTERIAPSGENLILSSADGKVILIKPFDKMEFMGDGGTQVSVFMSVFDVHVNRAPISGRVKYVKYNKGKFLPAFQDKASLENEQTEIGLENEYGRIILKQIAGIIARRIVCKIKPGDSVKAGQRVGMIKFGSRVDLFLPQSVEIKVELNQRVKAGETVIGVFKK